MKRIVKYIRKPSPAIMTKKDGSVWMITGKKRKKVVKIKGPNEERAKEIEDLFIENLAKYMEREPEVAKKMMEIIESESNNIIKK